MRSEIQKKTRRLATAGLLAALACVALFFGSMIELVDLSASALAALVVMVAVVELGKGWATGVYAVAAVISVLILPSTATVVFAAFLGYYPIIKVFLDKIRPKILQYAVKLTLFNGFLTVAMWLCVYILGVENEWAALGWALYVLGNATFVVFDFAIGVLAVWYINRIGRRIHRK